MLATSPENYSRIPLNAYLAPRKAPVPTLIATRPLFRAHLRFARSPNMKIVSKWIVVSAVISLAAALCMISSLPVMQASADHVRWDIQHFNPTTTPPTSSAGGVAFASARNPSSLSIKLTGSGTFVGPPSGGTSGGVTGGGTWETFSGDTSTGSGTYEVREQISWQFANFATP